MYNKLKKSLILLSILLLGISLSGCPSSTGSSTNNETNNTNNTNNHPVCEASEESGFYLVAIGSVNKTAFVDQEVTIKAMVVKKAESEHAQDGYAPGYPVHFEITSGENGNLNPTDVNTNEFGMVSATFSAGKSGKYYILASAEGVCSKQYTVDVKDMLLALDPLDSNPQNTYVGRRITIGVRAYNKVAGEGEMPFSGKPVTFEIINPQSGMNLEDTSGSSGNTITVNTDAGGKASLFFYTGTNPSTASIRATLDGYSVEPVTIQIQINPSGTGGSCTTNIDCPPDAPKCENGVCIETSSGGLCDEDGDCMEPYTCNTSTHQCEPPSNGQKCNMLSSANQCPAGQICSGGYCVDKPGDTGECTTNDDCPVNYICVNTTCVPDGDEPECVQATDCPDPNNVCINGICMDPAGCELQDSPTRLGGTWDFDSMLHLREAVGPFLGGILSASEILRDIILGNFTINGLPGWVVDAINTFLQDLIDEYVPPWAQQLIVALGDVSDIIDDMRVLHTVNLIPQGNDEYYGTQVWDLVEFEYRGNHVSDSPENILGFEVIPDDFTSREICGVFYIDRYYVRNVVGGLIRWAIDVMVTAATCHDGGPCYFSLEDALYDIIDCDAIATALDDLVYSMWEDAPSVYDPVYNYCDSEKGNAINQIISALDEIEVRLSLLSMRGVSPIVDDSHLSPGHWYGSLAGGSFNGEFTAVKH